MMPGIKRTLTDVVLWADYLSQDSYGAPTYAAPVSILAFWRRRVKRIVDAQGQERVAQHWLLFDADLLLDIRDKLTLPDGTTSPILALSSPRLFSGAVDHHEVYC